MDGRHKGGHDGVGVGDGVGLELVMVMMVMMVMVMVMMVMVMMMMYTYPRLTTQAREKIFACKCLIAQTNTQRTRAKRIISRRTYPRHPNRPYIAHVLPVMGALSTVFSVGRTGVHGKAG